MSDEKSRVNIHRHYYRIADEQCRVYSENDTSMSKWKSKSGRQRDAALEKHPKYYEKREQAAVIGITFAAMCLEAFFYDYAASNLDDLHGTPGQYFNRVCK